MFVSIEKVKEDIGNRREKWMGKVEHKRHKCMSSTTPHIPLKRKDKQSMNFCSLKSDTRYIKGILGECVYYNVLLLLL